ncbi:hypothetical protein VKT23_015236 [Stygiomarasmius scandens]|uniref:Uncharacterized protein n=1 Tax=Marasmiellus scandens TaxID=2682957 RepID=A0ABR1IYG2_9AGAR
MPFTTTHDIFHLLPLVREINLADPLWQGPPEVYDWFHYVEPREAALLALISETDSDIFKAPRCKKRRDIWHQVEICLDIETTEVGSLKRLDEYYYDCGCPSVLFRLDMDHLRCIRRALTDLDDRYAQYSPEAEIQPPVPFTQKTEPPTPSPSAASTSSRKRTRDILDEEELPITKKFKHSRPKIKAD